RRAGRRGNGGCARVHRQCHRRERSRLHRLLRLRVRRQLPAERISAEVLRSAPPGFITHVDGASSVAITAKVVAANPGSKSECHSTFRGPVVRATSSDLHATELVDDHHRESWINYCCCVLQARNLEDPSRTDNLASARPSAQSTPRKSHGPHADDATVTSLRDTAHPGLSEVTIPGLCN